MVLYIAILNVIIWSVIMLNVVMLRCGSDNFVAKHRH